MKAIALRFPLADKMRLVNKGMTPGCFAGTSWCIFHVQNVHLQCVFSLLPSLWCGVGVFCLFYASFDPSYFTCHSNPTFKTMHLCFYASHLGDSGFFRDVCRNGWFTFSAWQLIYLLRIANVISVPKPGTSCCLKVSLHFGNLAPCTKMSTFLFLWAVIY